MSSPAWPADPLHGQDAQQAHLKAWLTHNFLLRISDASIGTCKFLQVEHAPLFSATVTLRTPRELVLDMRRLVDFLDKCAPLLASMPQRAA